MDSLGGFRNSSILPFVVSSSSIRYFLCTKPSIPRSLAFNATMKHNVGLNDKYLEMMKNGTKVWEGRLNNAKYGAIQVGDRVVFESPTRTLNAMIEERRTFESFRRMLEDQSVEAFLPGDGQDLDGAVEVYRGFPGYRDGEAELGAIAFKIKALYTMEGTL